jgi:hypothetical protein
MKVYLLLAVCRAIRSCHNHAWTSLGPLQIDEYRRLLTGTVLAAVASESQAANIGFRAGHSIDGTTDCGRRESVTARFTAYTCS